MQPAPYLEILNLANQRVALLSPASDGVKNARLERQVNGEVKLKFILPRESEKWGFIDGLHKVRVNGHVFWIVGTEEERDQSGRLLSNVQCEEIWARDLGKLRGNYLAVEILSATAEGALNVLLAGTGWTVGSVTATGIHDLEAELESCLWNVRKVQEIWGGILVFDSVAKTVSLLADADYGQDNGVQFRYAKQLKNIRRTVDHDIVTRLYPFGKDGLDISSVNGGLKYIDNTQYTTEVFEDTWVNHEYDTPAELKTKAVEVLEQLSRPRATYTIKLVDLSSLTGYEVEAFDLGDWVTVIDPDIIPADVKVRINRWVYDVFEPWNAEVELGDAQETLTQFLANAGRAAQLVNKVVAPNPSVGSLLKGVLNTFYTQINGASGKATMEDGVLTFVEVDGPGVETGNRVRISPAGIGISTDHGQTYTTALTGAGIAANTVICNALYALATEDGFTRLTGTGLECWDNQAVPVMRGKFGQYQAGKFGLELRDKTGNVVILDEDGILQTWQEGRADNVDGSNSLVLNVYLPPETKSVHKGLLRFRRLAFRAYSASAASGGGHTVSISTNTTGASSTTTTGPSSSDTTTVSNHSHTYGQKSVSLTHGFNTRTTSTESGHSHTVSDKSADSAYLDVDTTWGGGSHSHGMSHTHTLSHTHGMSHDHTISAHAHAIIYGIYTGATPGNVTVKVNNTTIGTYSSDQADLNIKDYLVAGQWNIVELSATSLGRIDATVFIQAKMGV